MKIDKLLQDFLFHCKFEKNLNPKTIAAYTMDIEQFKTFKDIKIWLPDYKKQNFYTQGSANYSDLK
mgnify:CR=1 FL=1